MSYFLPAADAPPDPEGVRSFFRGLSRCVRDIMIGKTNNIGTVTLTANAASTTLSDANIRVTSVIVFDPKTATAWTAYQAASFRVLATGRADGSQTIAHNNTADADKTFGYVIHG